MTDLYWGEEVLRRYQRAAGLAPSFSLVVYYREKKGAAFLERWGRMAKSVPSTKLNAAIEKAAKETGQNIPTVPDINAIFISLGAFDAGKAIAKAVAETAEEGVQRVGAFFELLPKLALVGGVLYLAWWSAPFIAAQMRKVRGAK